MEKPKVIVRLWDFSIGLAVVFSLTVVIAGGFSVRGALLVCLAAAGVAAMLFGMSRRDRRSRDAFVASWVVAFVVAAVDISFSSCVVLLLFLPDVRRLYVDPECFAWFQRANA